ncbi:hypothetical protein [Rhizobium sp. 21-4511-3d]
MAVKTLILIPIVLLLASAKGCQTLDAQLNEAAVTTGQTQAHFDFPDLPDACTAKVERVIPKVGEKVRWTQSRWEITADNRDQLAADCDAWGKQAKQKYAGNR